MIEVNRRRQELKERYSEAPFFQFLKNKEISTNERIAFYPAMGYFIMSFGDLNSMLLRNPNPEGPLDKYINLHTEEDDHHWPWYLEDLEKLGFNERLHISDVFRYLYSDLTKENRQLMYKLTQLLADCDSLEKLIVIEAIEETGNVLFSALKVLAGEIEKEKGITLRYCGDFHFSKETGHLINDNEDNFDWKKIELNPDRRERAISLTEKTFTLFYPWIEFLHAYAKEQQSTMAVVNHKSKAELKAAD